ncbi:MAG TPA: hypothetical protein VGR28_14295 [Candidatus Thermoplasmatota archaeon]|jgi:hypothetical protein|nr:hypothetical protein [Candidatus Thermoplasmatota archaeon]
MRGERRAVLGLALVAAAQAAWFPLILGNPSATVLAGAQVVGMVLATAGLARGARGRGALAGGLALNAAGSLGFSLLFLNGDLSTGIQAVSTLAAVLAAWHALLWAFEPRQGALRAHGMRVAFWVSAVPQLLWLPYDVAANTLQWVPGNVLALAGFLLAARHLPDPATAPSKGPGADPRAVPARTDS